MASAEQVENPIDTQGELERLHRRTQIARLRGLVVAALAAYDLPPVRLNLIAHRFNTTFRVDTTTGERYVLRINRSGTPAVDTVNSELTWLAALRRDTPLEVPNPVQTRDGSLLTVASAPGVPKPYICVLFRWLPGYRLRHGLTPRRMERAGTFMARLHTHAINWELPPGFVRGRVDWPIEAGRWLPDPFAPEIIASIRTRVVNTLSTEDAALVTAVLERVRAAEQILGQGKEAFGLIHADLHFNNLLFGRDAVRAIDFDDCGFGPRLFDLGVMLSAILGWPEYRSLRAGLLAGYRRVRPLPVEHEALVDSMIAARQIQDALWLLDSGPHPARSDAWVQQAQESLAPLTAFLESNPDLPVRAWLE